MNSHWSRALYAGFALLIFWSRAYLFWWRRSVSVAVLVTLSLVLWALAPPAESQRRMPVVRYQGFQLVRTGPNTARYEVKVKFEFGVTQISLSASASYKDSENREYSSSSDPVSVSVNLSNYYRRMRVAVPIPAGWGYQAGSLKFDGVSKTPSSVSASSVFVWVDVPADGQIHTLSIELYR